MHIFKTALVLTTLLSLTVLCACSDTGETPTYVRDIKPLVDVKCNGCHKEGGIAPFSLLTYEQISAKKEVVSAAVTARIMPPWQAAPGCADYRGDRSLTDEQIDKIRRWADAGAPLGDPKDAPVPVVDEALSLSRVDLELPVPVPYTPQNFPDDYRCFFLDWPATSNTYITGFGVAPGNPQIVHHAIVYIVRPENVARFQALDDADATPGWACFGSPLGTGAAMGPNLFSWLGGWAPGLVGQDLPEGTGVEIPAGSKLVVQVHYYSASRVPTPDRTKVLLKTDAVVQKKAAVMPFANPQWVMAAGMNIPARTNNVIHSYESDPTVLVSLVTGGALPSGKPLTLYQAGQHMHLLAQRSLTRLEHADGTKECLLDIPHWDFHWQPNPMLRTPKRILPGDKLYMECQWNNPGDKDVNWGEGTSDEMCLGIYYLTE